MRDDEAILDFDQPAVKRLFVDWAKRATGIFAVKIHKVRPHRSNEQNAYFHGVVVPFLMPYYRDAWGDATTFEVKDDLKRRFLAVEKVNRQTGEVSTVIRPTSSLDTAEFSLFIERINQFAIEQFGVSVPPANRRRKREEAAA